METILGGLFVLMLTLQAADLFLPPGLKGVLTWNFPGLLWQWVLGAVIAERLARRPPAPLRPAVVLVVATLSAVTTCAAARLPHGILLLSVIGPATYAVVVFVASSMRFSGGRALRALEGIGVRSYSLYLTHPIALTLSVVLLGPWFGQQSALLAGIAFVAAYLGAVLYFALVERRFLYRRPLASSVLPAAAISEVGVPRLGADVSGPGTGL